jgi:hypothetical protein
VRPAGVLARVVSQLEELLDVRVPRLQVDAGGPLAPAALVHRGDRGVQRLEERHYPVGRAVGAADQRPPRPDPGPADADPAGELAQPGHLRVTVVDRAKVVARRVDEEAGRHLRVAGARVEQGRRARQVGEGGHQPVEPDRLGRRPRQPAGDPQHEVLRSLDDQPGGRVAQQVAVVDGPDAEVLEFPVGAGRDRVVELARVVLDERRAPVADQALGVAEADRLAEGRDPLPADLLVGVGGQQPRRQPRVLRLLTGHLGRGLDRQPVKLGGGRPVIQATNRLRRDPQRVDLGQVIRAALHRAHDLVHVDRLGVPVSLADPHRCPGLVACAGLCSRHGSLLASSHLVAPGRGRTTRTAARQRTAGHPSPSAVPRGRSRRAPIARGALAGLRTRGHSASRGASYWPSLPRLIRPSAD